MMHEHDIDLLANRLNYDAIVFKGCTMNELLVIAGVSFSLSCMLFALLLQLYLDNFLYGIALGVLCGGALSYLACALFEKMRRGKEKGYVQQWLKREAAKTGLMPKSAVIRRSGEWMIGRKWP